MAIPNVSVSDIWETIWTFTYEGQKTMLTAHYRVDSISGGTRTIIQASTDLRNELDQLGGVSQQLAGCYVDSAINGLLSIQKIFPARYLKIEGASAFPTGTNGDYDVTLPANTNMALTLRSINAGRHFRGTKHIGCLGSNFVTDGEVNANGLAALALLGDAMSTNEVSVNGGVTITWAPIILNRVSPSVSADIFNYTRGISTRVQRRRTVGLGI